MGLNQDERFSHPAFCLTFHRLEGLSRGGRPCLLDNGPLLLFSLFVCLFPYRPRPWGPLSPPARSFRVAPWTADRPVRNLRGKGGVTSDRIIQHAPSWRRPTTCHLPMAASSELSPPPAAFQGCRGCLNLPT